MNLLLLDDDTQLRLQLEEAFAPERVGVVAQPDPSLAIAALGSGAWVGALVCLDGGEGAAVAFLEALSWVDGLDIPVIVTSATRSIIDDEVKLARELWPDAIYLRKPVQLRRLRQLLGDLEPSSVRRAVVDEDLPELATSDLELLDDAMIVEIEDSTVDEASEPTVIERV